MMMDSGLMGGHMIWVTVILLAVMIGILFVILSLRKAPRDSAVQQFSHNYGAARRAPEGPGLLRGSVDNGQAVEERVLIVIPDISGYTRFITKSRFALAHAHFVVEELLDAVMAAGVTCFTPMRVEGDAILFRAPIDQADPEAVGHALVGILEAFYQKRAQLKHDNVCRCSICKNIAELDLKIIVHAGDVLRFHMGDFEDATGEAMIDAHGLLKGVTHSHRYILVSDAAFPAVALSEDWEWDDFAFSRHDAEPLACHIVVVPDDRIEAWDRCGASRRSVQDFLNKMASLKKLDLAGT